MNRRVLGVNTPSYYERKYSPIDEFRHVQKGYNRWTGLVAPDPILVVTILLLMLFGLVMVTSASFPRAGSSGWVYSYGVKQLSYMTLGLITAFVVYLIPTRWWFEHSYRILLVGIFFLVLVVIPGVVPEINGSKRWIPVGPFKIQVSEFTRICIIIYAAAFLQRYQNQIHKSLWAMIRLLGVLGLVSVLLLLEPDFGSAAVICAVILGMMFLAGVCIVRFIICGTGVALLGSIVMILAPYRVKRLASFMNPWDDVWNSDYQLVNSLIAIGRGEKTGVGIGESLQKHHYLPEAHTDFIFSILAEETGLVGASVLLLLFAIIVWRAFTIANNADKVRLRFASCVAYGIGLWVGIQSLINMAVSSGLLPTKGLTLPLVSYGGSSVLASLILLAILLRIDSESRYLLLQEKNSHRNNKASFM